MRKEATKTLNLSDPGVEKAVLAGICQHGELAYVDVSDIIGSNAFTISNNQTLYKCLEIILAEGNQVDETTILATATRLGVEKILFANQQDMEFLRVVLSFPIKLENVRPYAKRLAKLEIARKLQYKLKDAYDNLNTLSGSESIDEILAIPENAIFDIIEEITNSNSDGPEQIAENGKELLESLLEHPSTMAGLPTPWKLYNTCIGGGLRRGGVNLIGARVKCGKSLLAKEAALHFTIELNIPVLLLDTEMVRSDQLFRSLASISCVHINKIETGQFGIEPFEKDKVFDIITRKASID